MVSATRTYPEREVHARFYSECVMHRKSLLDQSLGRLIYLDAFNVGVQDVAS